MARIGKFIQAAVEAYLRHLDRMPSSALRFVLTNV